MRKATLAICMSADKRPVTNSCIITQSYQHHLHNLCFAVAVVAAGTSATVDIAASVLTTRPSPTGVLHLAGTLVGVPRAVGVRPMAPDDS